MSRTKINDIDKYLSKELNYLNDLIVKTDGKQKQENNRFWMQCDQVKKMCNAMDDHRMELVKRLLTCEDYLGIDTGPLEKEQNSLSGLHTDVQNGTFTSQFPGGNKIN